MIVTESMKTVILLRLALSDSTRYVDADMYDHKLSTLKSLKSLSERTTINASDHHTSHTNSGASARRSTTPKKLKMYFLGSGCTAIRIQYSTRNNRVMEKLTQEISLPYSLV